MAEFILIQEFQGMEPRTWKWHKRFPKNLKFPTISFQTLTKKCIFSCSVNIKLPKKISATTIQWKTDLHFNSHKGRTGVTQGTEHHPYRQAQRWIRAVVSYSSRKAARSGNTIRPKAVHGTHVDFHKASERFEWPSQSPWPPYGWATSGYRKCAVYTRLAEDLWDLELLAKGRSIFALYFLGSLPQPHNANLSHYTGALSLIPLCWCWVEWLNGAHPRFCNLIPFNNELVVVWRWTGTESLLLTSRTVRAGSSLMSSDNCVSWLEASKSLVRSVCSHQRSESPENTVCLASSGTSQFIR